MEEQEFVVYRHGWNGANQSSAWAPYKMEVARVTAATAEQACELAANRVTVYNNQFLSAEPASEVDEDEAEIDRRVRLT